MILLSSPVLAFLFYSEDGGFWVFQFYRPYTLVENGTFDKAVGARVRVPEVRECSSNVEGKINSFSCYWESRQRFGVLLINIVKPKEFRARGHSCWVTVERGMGSYTRERYWSIQGNWLGWLVGSHGPSGGSFSRRCLGMDHSLSYFRYVSPNHRTEESHRERQTERYVAKTARAGHHSFTHLNIPDESREASHRSWTQKGDFYKKEKKIHYKRILVA